MAGQLLSCSTLVIRMSSSGEDEAVVDDEQRTVGFSRYARRCLELFDPDWAPVVAISHPSTSFGVPSVAVRVRDHATGVINGKWQLVAARGVGAIGETRGRVEHRSPREALVLDEKGGQVAVIYRVRLERPRSLWRAAMRMFFFTQVWRVEFAARAIDPELRLLVLACPVKMLLANLPDD